MPAIFTFGATPTMPRPFLAAAIVPAVCVPWPSSSIHAAGSWFGTPPTHETLREKSTFGARSGCVQSRPLSMSPTITEVLPPLIARASGAEIWSMSHWIELRGSSPGAGVPGSIGPAASVVPSSASCTPSAAVEAAPCTDGSAASTASPNPTRSEVTIATPICG